MRHTPAEKIIVLGAGFQGVCVALALRRRGYRVTLVDKAPDCMLRASLRNEGKIHMGFVYANDPTFRTSDLMLRSSLLFAPLVEEWAGGSVRWESLKSRPFTYVVTRDSLLPPDAILSSYERLRHSYQEMLEETGANYLGDCSRELWRESPADSVSRLLNPDIATKFVETVEVALELHKFRELIRAALAGAGGGVERLFGHSVESVTRTATGFRVEGWTGAGETWAREAGAVVNCLWEGRLRLDGQMGVAPKRKWVYRLKYRLLGELPRALSGLPSLTLVLGPFGDVVVNPPGRTYFSWYPACMRGWSTDLVSPRAWEGACAGEVESAQAAAVAREALCEIGEIIPGIERSRVDVVDAGIICSWGESDIDDPTSELHERHDVGVHSHDGYFSVDTGKLTCAPYFARQLLDALS